MVAPDSGNPAFAGLAGRYEHDGRPARIRPELPAVSHGKSPFLTASAVFCSSVHPMNTG